MRGRGSFLKRKEPKELLHKIKIKNHSHSAGGAFLKSPSRIVIFIFSGSIHTAHAAAHTGCGSCRSLLGLVCNESLGGEDGRSN